ncbi:MAG: DUF1292 domain-containing protein [Oscillospiraceae bacterium]|jgi:uncharacterized protein YrzB (UPF0473 family)|nr:DUF1292 domain-containing protein [Oscillospiraceae bacterium]
MAGGEDIFRPGDGAEDFDSEVLEDFGNDVVSVVDEDGKEHVFEELDRMDFDGKHAKGTYVALAPLVGEEGEEEGDDELILLRVEEEDGETYLSILEDEQEFDEVGMEFSKRLGIPFDVTEENPA